MAIERSYNWATILYPESCVENLDDALRELLVPCALSPLHDQDVQEDTGELKKPHYHLVLHYGSLKSQAQVRKDVLQLGAVGVERVRDLRVYVRYLAHMDNPDKAQYDARDIKAFNSFDVEKHLNGDKKISTDEGFAALVAISLEYGFTNYDQLIIYCLKNDAELLPSCRKSAYALTSFLRSRAYCLNADTGNPGKGKRST